MSQKYNIITIYSHKMDAYRGFFEEHKIQKKSNLITAWNTFTEKTPGQSKRYEIDGKTVFDIPEELKEWNIYLADTKTE